MDDQENSGSLDLLLDTMCNMFGGIVIIAILVALLMKQATHDGGGPIEDQNNLLLQQELRTASENLQAELSLSSLYQNQYDKGVALRPLLAEREELEDQIKDKREEQKRLEEELKTSQASVAAPSDARVMRDKLRDVKKEYGDKLNRPAELRAREQELNRQLEELEEAMANLLAGKDQAQPLMRPPPVTETDLAPIGFIIRYNRIFPLFTIGRTIDDISRNNESITWVGGMAIPKKEMGFDMVRDQARVGAIVQKIEKDKAYPVAFVYPDSFEAFNKFREGVIRSGRRMGWKPWPDGADIVFSDKGNPPPGAQ